MRPASGSNLARWRARPPYAPIIWALSRRGGRLAHAGAAGAPHRAGRDARFFPPTAERKAFQKEPDHIFRAVPGPVLSRSTRRSQALTGAAARRGRGTRSRLAALLPRPLPAVAQSLPETLRTQPA